MTFRLPSDSQRIVIIGRTGSGKTQAALWHLSKRRFDKMPWVIFDYKGEKLFHEIRLQEIEIGDVPKKPGLYVVRPIPGLQDAAIEAYLWKLWKRRNVGLFFDEGYQIPDCDPLRAILTQGRSLKIPVIILVQRPAWCSKFIFSEADFFQIFDLNDKDDWKRVAGFMPDVSDYELPDYYSFYYDVGRKALTVLKPVPDSDTILDSFEDRLKPKRRFL